MTSSALNGFGALRHRNFAFYLSARLLGTIAVQMQNVAVGWQVYAMTGNALDLGWIGLAQFAPFVALVLVAGQAADHFNRRVIIIVCHGVELLCALILLLFTLGGFQVLWPVFAVLALFGAARAFRMPTSQAILMNLVPLESFGNAVAISSSGFHVAVIVGPTVGGLLYLFGPAVVYGMAATLFLLAMLLMGSTHVEPPTVHKETPNWNTLLEGLRFVRSRPIVLGAISLDLFAVLFGGATALLPAYGFRSGRRVSACCERRRGPGPRSCRSCSRSSRCRDGSVTGCSAASHCSGCPRSCSASRTASGYPCSRCSSSAPAT